MVIASAPFFKHFPPASCVGKPCFPCQGAVYLIHETQGIPIPTAVKNSRQPLLPNWPNSSHQAFALHHRGIRDPAVVVSHFPASRQDGRVRASTRWEVDWYSDSTIAKSYFVITLCTMSVFWMGSHTNNLNAVHRSWENQPYLFYPIAFVLLFLLRTAWAGWMGPPESLAGSAERPVRCKGCAIYNPANSLILQELLVQAKLYQNTKCKHWKFTTSWDLCCT